MSARSRLLRDHRLWLELFVLVNLGFLSVDIYIAHSFNSFRKWAEYIPFYFSMAAPAVLLIALFVEYRLGWKEISHDLGIFIGWLAVGIGLIGVIFHLDSRFFYERTLKSLIYAAPFAAPLAYTGLGFLLIMNRMVDSQVREWPYWVIMMAAGGFLGNFVFSLTDHAQNGFAHSTEWIPVGSSALAVGFLMSLFVTPPSRPFLKLCVVVLLIQAAVGLLGFWLHFQADLHGPSARWQSNFIEGAPVLAPLLFPNLVLLSGIGLWVLWKQLGTAPTDAEHTGVAVAAAGK
jgi:hypothetical protein